MLGFQYVVAKSRELSSALDRELSAASNRAAPFTSVSSTPTVESAASNVVPAASTASNPSVRNEGQEFLRAQQKLHVQAVSNHQKLMHSGQELDAALARARATLQAQAASEQFLAQNFHLVSSVRQQLAGVRSLVLKLAEEADEVETLLVQRCEESAARQNAEFAAKQQQELEKFEARIARESEGRKRELLEMRRHKLASAFMNDLKTYQTLVAHHGDAAAAEARLVKDEKEDVTLDEVDLVVTADPDQLDAFYDSGSEEEEEAPHSPRFSSPPVPNELVEEEEKSEEKEETAEKEEIAEAGEELGEENAEKEQPADQEDDENADVTEDAGEAKGGEEVFDAAPEAGTEKEAKQAAGES
ncbi:hypothetical protein PR001_g16569 [Phytophthora rubi]|uniref:Uncharacterized protein n=1 Tax=Phytophthora rubi TaxID=129364 RepID=A0A6A3KMZ1_9STRA|nr:hypothetical protein PR002_g16860 [Phytophthora rubi]KAE9008927.1 hypothetical protein PR001_g16569 [Phytophthora rubi]